MRTVALIAVGVVAPVAVTTVMVARLWADYAGRPASGAGIGSAAGPLAHVTAVVAVFVTVAHLGGVLAHRMGQPRVVGQAVAGLLLGPSLLGRTAPALAQWLHSGKADTAVDLLAHLGLVVFVFLVARELAAGDHFGGSRAVVVGQTMVAVPLLVGVVLAAADAGGQRPPGVNPATYALFIGLAMSATALPVLAHILAERRLLTSRVGGLGVASAAFGDATVWGVLALVLCLAADSDPTALALRLAAAAGVAATIWFAVRPALGRLMRADRDSTYAGPAFLLAGLLGCAYATDALGLHAIFGAFLFGLAVPGRSLIVQRTSVAADSLTQALLLPMFFTMTGSRVDLGGLNTVTVGYAALILFIAVISKIAAAGGAGRWLGLSWHESLALGVMMNCRGLTELIILNVGLTAGLITTTTFTAFFLMALITTAVTGPLLNLAGMRGQSDEAPVSATAAQGAR